VLRIQAAAGPRAGQLAMAALDAHDGALKGFTQRLLRHRAWLVTFYLHQLSVWYSFAVSCYAKA